MPGGVVIPIAPRKSGARAPKPRTFSEATPALGVCLFSALGGLLFGYDTGVISGIIEMQKFRRDFGEYFPYNVPGNLISADNPAKPGWSLSTGQRSLVVSILSAGTFVGSLSAAFFADRLGRKRGLQFAVSVFTAGVILQCCAAAVPVYALGRFVAGLGVGAVSMMVPLYQSEVAPEWLRGALVTTYQWMITIGLLIASIIDNGTQHRNDKSAYIIPIALQFIFSTTIFIGLFFLPDSPRWYVKRGDDDRAAQTLAKLNSTTVDSDYVRDEMNAIKTSLELELQQANGGYKEIFSRGERKVFTRVAVGATLQALQQLTGINFIFYYGVTFFRSTGAKNPFVFSVISNVVNVLSTVPGMWMMERIGRRPLFIYGALWMFVSQLIVACVGTAEPISNRTAQQAAVAFVCIYIAGFASTWGPAAWVITGEMFPLSVRAKALSISTASQWLWNFGIGYSTPYLVDQGPGRAGLGPRVYFIWAGCCLICIAFSVFWIVETAGLTLEEVDELYATVDPIHSSAFNKQLKKRRADSLEEESGTKGDETGAAASAGAAASDDDKKEIDMIKDAA